MGLRTVKTLCECNGTVAPKDILPTCTPILKAAARSKCGLRRMLVSIVILLIMAAIVYCASLTNHQRVNSFTNRLSWNRQQPQPVAGPPPPLVAGPPPAPFAELPPPPVIDPPPPPMEEPVASAEAEQSDAEPAAEPEEADTCKQPFYQLHQPDGFMSNNQCLPGRNPCQPMFHTASNVPPAGHTQPGYAPLSQNVFDQIRGYVSNATPIFILPSSCPQSGTQHQQPVGTLSQGGVPQPTGQSTAFNYPPSIYCPPPPFYPYPIPLPVYEPSAGQACSKGRLSSCGCCQRKHGCGEANIHPWSSCCCSVNLEEHRCTATADDTICSQRNCPASISLQALASQFLSLPGIISCAATRLILRKVPGSNITSTTEDTMNKAQRSISVLTKDQLLAESRNAQQLTALINLHITTNVPANVIPLLTLLQLKVNVLKAQVEALINRKVMECQGYGFEVESSGPIDPAVLALKTNAELRQLLTALRQKECDERLNVNFSPYVSQRVIAESRLKNVQVKICQVEAEFDNRRTACYPTPTITSRIIQQFAESRCTFGYAQTWLFDTDVPENALHSPDPFEPSPRNPRRLYLKPRVPEPIAAQQDQCRATSTSEDGLSACKDKGTGGEGNEPSKERSVERESSTDSCSCDKSSSEDSLDEDKKKLRLQIHRTGDVRMCSVAELRDVSLLKLAPNITTVVVAKQNRFQADPIRKDNTGRRSMEIREAPGEDDRINEVKSNERKEDSVEEKELKEELEEKDIPMEAGKVAGSSAIPLGKVKVEPSEGVTFVGEKRIDLDLDTLKQSEVASKEQAQSKSVEKLRTVETREAGGSSSIQTTIKESETESSDSGETQGQKTISEDVPEESESEQMAKDSPYSGSRRSFCGIRLKPAAGSDANKSGSSSNGVNQINPEIDESRRGNDERGNVQIVSMMAGIEYDRRFGDFSRWMVINEHSDEKGKDRCRGTSVRDTSVETEGEDGTEENHTCLVSSEVNSPVKKMFGGSHLGEKAVDGIRHFPPLKYATPSRRATMTDISKNVFHEKEIESSSSRIVCDRGTSYHCDTITGHGIVSAICSMIESQLDTVGSLLGNMPNLQNVLSNLYPDKLRSSNKDVSSSNKETLPPEDDWTLLPGNIDDDDRHSPDVNYISVREQRNAARTIRHSIIVDKERKNYVLIGGSISGQSRVLAKNGFERPYRARRSLIIRSRLKDREKPEHELAYPIKVPKRSKRSKSFASRVTKGVQKELRSSRKSYRLFKGSRDVERSETIIRSDETIDNLIDTQEYRLLGAVSQNATLKRGNESIDSSNFSVVTDERSLPESEQVTGTQDYFTVQEGTSV